MTTPFEIYTAANARLDERVDIPQSVGRTRQQLLRRAQRRWLLTLKALERAGNPERQAPVIHLAGTSGKGSTATTIARILEAASYRTLLHTSPYLQVSTEKLVVDGQLIDVGQFADLVEAVLSQERGGQLRYGEAWLLLIAKAIASYRPDVAIIETGAGGTWDLTNLIWSEVAVITSVGLDHTETLGDTISEIARHKAGIIKQGASVVHAVDDPDAVAEILAQAQAREAKVEYVGRLEALNVRPERDNHWSWRDPLTGERLVAGLPGKIQARNAALAVAAARAWRSDLPIGAIRAGLASTRFPARFERMPGMQTVILDGAHNQQKMAALILEIARLPQPRVGVLGFLAAKRADEMIAQLAPHLDEIVLTSPHIVGKPALDVDRAMTLARSLTQVPISGRAVPLAALDLAIGRAGAEGSVVATGSLYLCGALRERWYGSEEIITQNTQWPSTPGRP